MSQIEMLSSPVIVYATVQSLQAGMMTMSIPPQIRARISLSDIKSVRGSIEGSNFLLMAVGQLPPVQPGQKVVLYGSYQEDSFAFSGLLANMSFEEAQSLVANQPFGWISATQSPYSKPFEHTEVVEHYKDVCTKTCSNSARPAVKVNAANLQLKVEKVIPADVQEYGNPYGNGLFTFTVKNTGNKKEITPIFRGVDSKKIYGEFSVIAVVDSKSHVFETTPTEKLEFVELEAGEEVKFEVNTLKYPTIEVPCGGSRIYFTFGLGPLVANDFFYYYSSIHDAMRKAALQ